MKFNQLLSYYRDQANLSKTELANAIKVTPGYIMNLESGRRKPPTLERCHQLIKILKLNDKESKLFYKAAQEGRQKLADRKFAEQIIEKTDVKSQIYSNMTPDILEALQDPIAVKVLLIAHKNSQDIKNTIKALLETLPNLSLEKRQAILALCK